MRNSELEAKRKARLESELAVPYLRTERVTRGGRVDPNAEAKDKLEAKLLAILAALLGIHLTELLAILGSPPDWSKVPTPLWHRWEAELAQTARPVMNQAALIAGERLVLVQNYPVSLERLDSKARRWSAMRSLSWATAMTLSTRRATWERVARVVAEPDRSLAKDLETHFGKGRAETEAAYETTNAFTEGERLVVDDLPEGIQAQATWRTERDSEVCLICEPLDDVLESDWGIGVEPPPTPHYGCRCWLTYEDYWKWPAEVWARGGPSLVGQLPGRDRPYIEGILL